MPRQQHSLPEIGTRYGRWTVTGAPADELESNGSVVRVLPCRCECGTERTVPFPRLYKGASLSCGCLRNEQTAQRNTTHGLTKSPVYTTWKLMLRRCESPKDPHWDRYGGRGISVCEEWRSIQVFHDWAMANGHAPGLEIDRIDNDGDYEPSNCRFVTHSVNIRNKSDNRILDLFGERKTVADWAEDPRCAVSHVVLRTRVAREWPPLRAVTELPSQSRSRVVKTTRTYVTEVLQGEVSLTPREIYEATLKIGAVYRSKDPFHSLNSSLQAMYGLGLVAREGSPVRYRLA